MGGAGAGRGTQLSREQLAILALTALAVFWVVGAYNRLMALRNAIGAAWSKLAEAQAQRAAAAEPLLAALRGPLAAEAGALDALQAALGESARATGLLSARPVAAEHARAWVAAEAAVAATASRVLALLDQHASLKEESAVADGRAAWQDASARLGFGRQMFNETAAPYDEAISMFPTRLLVGLFRFGPAGRL